MESRAYAWAAGLFTLLLGLAVLVAATWFSGETYERKYYVVETHSPVTGLNPQSTVRLRGVDVGKVETIDFADGNASVILVRIAVRADTPITARTIAQLRPQGITGLSYIMLDERNERTGALPAVGAGRIPMRPSFTEEVADTAQALLVDARALVGRLNEAMSDRNLDNVGRTLESLETAAQRIAGLTDALQPAARGAPAMVDEARRTLAAVRPTLASIEDVARRLGERVEVLDRVARSAEQVGATAETLGRSITAEALPRVNVLLDEVARTTGNLDRLLTQLRDQPSSVVFGAPRAPPGPGEAGYTAEYPR